MCDAEPVAGLLQFTLVEFEKPSKVEATVYSFMGLPRIFNLAGDRLNNPSYDVGQFQASR